WAMDRHPRIRARVAAQLRRRGIGLHSVPERRTLDVHHLRLELGERLGLGLGSLPLWPLGLDARLRLGLDRRHHLGSGLGGLAVTPPRPGLIRPVPQLAARSVTPQPAHTFQPAPRPVTPPMVRPQTRTWTPPANVRPAPQQHTWNAPQYQKPSPLPAQPQYHP